MNNKFLLDGRLFAGNRQGEIFVFDTATKPFINKGIYLTISPVSRESEGGITGIAFHPKWPQVPRIFVSWTPTTHSVALGEFEPEGDPLLSYRANPIEVKRILTIEQPGFIHNSGNLLFGPEGYLYFFLGDGGSENHTESQDLKSWHGKIHRLDIDNRGEDGIIPRKK